MRYALIGCGRIARRHIYAALQNNLEIVALCDLCVEKAEKYIKDYSLKEKNPQIKIYSNYLEMLAKERLDLVAIATESGKHAGIAKKCLTHNTNVIIEKPIALSTSDAQSIIDTAKEYHKKICICHQNRFNNAIQQLRDAVEKERFGRILYGTLHVRWFRGADYYSQSSWRGTWAQDGGALMNQCIHGIDLLLWMMGSPVREVYGTIKNMIHPQIQAEDLGVAVLKFANGSVATIEGTTDVFEDAQESCLCIFGTDGTVKIGGPALNAIEKWSFREKCPGDENWVTKENIKDIYGNSHPKIYKDMITALATNTEPCVTGLAGKNAMDVILAIYKSTKEGKPVTFPMKGFSTLDMKEFSWE